VNQEQKKKLIIIAGLTGFLVILPILVISFIASSKKKDQTAVRGKGANFAVIDGQFQDKICQTSFTYPDDWIVSELKLPLSQDPLSQAVFDQPAGNNQPAKNSILSYLCFDASQYTIDQFLTGVVLGSGETIRLGGNLEWQRNGNFAYTVSQNKLIIFQMFFTKYDIKPEAGYEEAFLGIIESVKFF
jgi:hypothetical protein